MIAVQRACVSALKAAKHRPLGQLIFKLHGGSARFGHRDFGSLPEKRRSQAAALGQLPEVKRRAELRALLRSPELLEGKRDAAAYEAYASGGVSREDALLALEAALVAFLLHVEARIANHLGEGFYTIGPCGEELLSAVALCLEASDACALHYRHLGTSVCRSLKQGKSMEQLLLDRARSFCVSSLEPLSGGAHCLLGGSQSDFLVTSTLASQAPPAVGRAAGLRLAAFLGLPARLPGSAISYVSLGDGSVNNAHFLTALNLAEYMQHRGFQCPVVFAVSDNDRCISLRGHGWLAKYLSHRVGMPIFRADGNNLLEIIAATRNAAAHARQRGAPATVVFEGLSRRFGHAATDRQEAYLSQAEIDAAEENNALAAELIRAVHAGIWDSGELARRFDELVSMVEHAFDAASAEPKITSRTQCLSVNSQPLVPKEKIQSSVQARHTPQSTLQSQTTPHVMRRHMNRVLDELLEERKELVYIGEDVQHGGYYRVTEGLHAKYGWRVADFPPDETALIGVAIGYSQVGLLPIVELPYAKYLDCGADMFFEAVIMNWLSGGKQPNGMVIRLQGFDRGVFGGNFHTHNSLYLPPGLDVVAYSNGNDYVQGMRHAVAQAAAGRVVMVVDSTDLLNRRHVFEKDDGWLRPYPAEKTQVMSFDEVRVYGSSISHPFPVLIVSYGNGVVASLQAQRCLEAQHGVAAVVVDVPYVSGEVHGLLELLHGFKAVVFADPCKLGQNPHAGLVLKLQAKGLLPQRWRCVASAATYNPLGSTVTFLSAEDITAAVLEITEPHGKV